MDQFLNDSSFPYEISINKYQDSDFSQSLLSTKIKVEPPDYLEGYFVEPESILKGISSFSRDLNNLSNGKVYKRECNFEDSETDEIPAPFIVQKNEEEYETITIKKEYEQNSDISLKESNDYSQSNIKTYERRKSKINVPQLLKSTECDELFVDISSLKEHEQMHNIYKCNLCSYFTNTENGLKIHKYSHRKTIYSCKLCKFDTQIISHYKIHMLSHKKKRMFTCNLCSFNTENYEDLNNHKTEHKNNFEYTCDVCGYKAKQKHHLEGHAIIHLPHKTWKCDECDYVGVLFRYLRTHMKIHTSKLLMQCNKCTYHTVHQDKLIQHKKNECSENT